MSYPNTLTIFINTRIRGFSKIKYEPDMTVPNIKSETVFFNPLIKLNRSISLKIPPGYPDEEKFTQFFNKSDFNSLVSRNVASGFQKKMSIEDAKKYGIIDNNIKVTLDILFKKNNRFYIKGKPYTIFSHEWINGDWQVNKKSFEKQLMESSYGQGMYNIQQNMLLQNKLADDEFIKFQKEHSDSISGFAISSDISKFKDDYGLNNNRDVARGLIIKPKTIEESLKYPYEEDSKTEIPKIARNLATKKLVYQNIINLDEDANLSNDPVSINLLYSINRNYSDDIKLNNKVLDPLYQSLLKKGKIYKQKKEIYDKSVGEYFSLINAKKTNPVAIPVDFSNEPLSEVTSHQEEVNESSKNNIFKNKKMYDETVKQINVIINNNKTNGITYENLINNINLKNDVIKIIVLLEKYKVHFLNSFLESLKLLVNKIYSQINYIKALYAFYSQLYIVKERDYKLNKSEKEYQNILKLNIIKFDVQCYKSILNNIETIEDRPLSNTLQSINKMISYIDNFIKKEYAIPKNYVEMLQNYYEHPILLQLNRYQFDVYMFSVLKYDFTIDLGMWKILYRQTDVFLSSIKDYIIGNDTIEGKISLAKILIDQYNEKYTQQQRDIFHENVVKLKTPIQKINPSMLDFAFPDSEIIKTQQNDYVKYQNAIRLCYDLITVYSRISAIKYSREISLVAARQNLCYVLDKIYKRMNKSYEEILKESESVIQLIPNYVYLTGDSYKTHEALQNSIKINTNAQFINKNKNSGYKIVMRSLRKKYNDAIDILIPEITKLGILQKCEEILDDYEDDSNSDVESIYEDDATEVLTPGEKIKRGYQKIIEKYFDQDNTIILQKHIANLYNSGVSDGVIQQINEDEINNTIKNWAVINNKGGGDCLFLAIAMIFNGELINNNNNSNNPFADSNGYFSKTSLRNAVADETYGITNQEISLWDIHRNIENIDDSDPNTSEDEIRLKRDFSFLLDDQGRWIGNNESTVRKVIRENSKYWGDQTALFILERIFKVKFIIIDTTRPKVFPKGTDVRFLNSNGKEMFGVVTKNHKVAGTNEYLYEIAEVSNSANIIHTGISSINNNVTLSEDGYYRVVSLGADNSNANEFSNYAFLLLTTITESGAQHFEIMHSNLDNKFIYKFDEIPDYLKYLVFKTQWKYLTPDGRRNGWYGNNNIFRDYLNTLTDKYNRNNIKKGRIRRIPKKGGGHIEEPVNNLYGGQMQLANKYININNSNTVRTDDSKLSYYIIIDLELYPGDSIPLIKQPVIACHLRYEKIRQAFADMFGLLYQPTDFYKTGDVAPSTVKYRKEDESRENKSKVRYYPLQQPNYNTRRFNVSYYGGKKTRKNKLN
jgi:hypothetical protein